MEVTLRCVVCGKDLAEMHSLATGYHDYGKLIFEVTPCETCMGEADKKAYEEGVKHGNK